MIDDAHTGLLLDMLVSLDSRTDEVHQCTPKGCPDFISMRDADDTIPDSL